MRHLTILICLLAVAIAGCATPGAPLPPSLGIPKPVSDLRAVRKGAVVTLTWSAPSDTTDGELIRKRGRMQLTRTVGSASSVVADVPLEPTLKQDQASALNATDSLQSVLPAGTTEDFAVYSVTASGNSGTSAGPGTQVRVALAPTLPAPPQLRVTTVPPGVSVAWDQAWPPQNPTHLTAQYAYRIMRRQEGSNAATMVQQINAGNTAIAFVDTTIEWQKHYEYWITPVTLWQNGGKKGEVEGDDSPVVPVFANDIFPPEAPSGLQAVFSGVTQQPAIDLTWTPNTEPDLAGYNVYRHSANEAPVKINAELIKTPLFHDTGVKAGMKYFYSVSAVDLRGNESGKSAETSEAVPAD